MSALKEGWKEEVYSGAQWCDLWRVNQVVSTWGQMWEQVRHEEKKKEKGIRGEQSGEWDGLLFSLFKKLFHSSALFKYKKEALP